MYIIVFAFLYAERIAIAIARHCQAASTPSGGHYRETALEQQFQGLPADCTLLAPSRSLTPHRFPLSPARRSRSLPLGSRRSSLRSTQPGCWASSCSRSFQAWDTQQVTRSHGGGYKYGGQPRFSDGRISKRPRKFAVSPAPFATRHTSSPFFVCPAFRCVSGSSSIGP